MCPIAMRQAGIQGPYTYTTATYDGDCLAKFGLAKVVAAEGGNYIYKAAATRIGSASVTAFVDTATSTPVTAVFLAGGAYAVLKECKCHDN